MFPRLREKLSASELTFVDSLEREHIKAGTICADLKKITLTMGIAAEPSAESVEDYLDYANRLRALYGSHIRAEDGVFVELARTMP